MNMGYADMLINALANITVIGVVVGLFMVATWFYKKATWICKKVATWIYKKARAGEKDKPGAAHV